MSLIARYVAAVKRYLPNAVREDIGRELHSAISDEVDALEAAQGQPLNDAQIADFLRRRGHPIEIAAAFRNKSLIGPKTFFIYSGVLKAGLAVIIAALVARLVFEGNVRLVGLLYDFYWSVLGFFGWATFIFFLLDVWLERRNFFERWDPLRLRSATMDQFPIGTGTAVAETVFGILLLMFVADGATISGRWLNTGHPVTVSLIDIPSILILLHIGIIVAIGIALTGFVERHWTPVKLLPFAIAQLLVGGILGTCAILPAGVVVNADPMPPDHLASIQYTARFILALFAIRCLSIGLVSLSRLKRFLHGHEETVSSTQA
ncbi:hypothetical protein [Microbulbifer halophilus]|uniref:Uncharacterized protein n=1 Tax=Microbulbifer halophilus TaxID=453963 RepID=A0ABW5EDY1_9GAMM|nr:hypothetical protein [Microbulbifer halophilus]MCW8128559.1 hypothetical protein [Microbulbifer halophilus]